MYKLTRYTTVIRISCKARWTFANSSVTVHSALCCGAARIVYSTRIDTSSVPAGLSEGTLIIRVAPYFYWGS